MEHATTLLDDPAEYLQRFLPSDYIPPHGTKLTAESFRSAEHDGTQTWVVHLANAQGTEDQYTLFVSQNSVARGSRTATCKDHNDEPVQYIHPYTRRSSDSAPLEEWYDFLLVQDAVNRFEASQSHQIWSRNDVEGQLYRIQRGLVAFGIELANTANFRNPMEFQDWINGVVEQSPASFTVGAITDPKKFHTNVKETLLCIRTHEHEENRLVATRIPESLDLKPGRPSSPHDLGRDVPCEISFDLVMDGTAFETFHGDFMTFFEWADDSLAASHERPDWYVVAPDGLNALLPVPSDGGVITVRHDSDGASIRVELMCEAHAARQNQLEETYQRRWGAWLDDDVALAPEELDAGVAAVEAALEELRTREANGEATHGSAH